MKVLRMKQSGNKSPCSIINNPEPTPKKRKIEQEKIKSKKTGLQSLPQDGTSTSRPNKYRKRQNTSDLLLTGLSTSLADKDIKEHFESFGRVCKAQVNREFTTGRSLGSGIVKMADLRSEAQLLKGVHTIDQQIVRIKKEFEKIEGD